MDTLVLILHWIFWAYITAECFICFYYMNVFGKGPRFIKYGTAALVPFIGLVSHYLRGDMLLQYLWLVPDFAVAQFLFTKTLARYRGKPQRSAA